MFGLRPWFALERRAFSFFFWVRFDIPSSLTTRSQNTCCRGAKMRKRCRWRVTYSAYDGCDVAGRSEVARFAKEIDIVSDNTADLGAYCCVHEMSWSASQVLMIRDASTPHLTALSHP